MKFTPKQQKAVDDSDKIYSKLNIKDRTYIEEQKNKKFDCSRLAISESLNLLYGDKTKKNISILLIILFIVIFAVVFTLSSTIRIAESTSIIIGFTFMAICIVLSFAFITLSHVRKSNKGKFNTFLSSLFIIRITGGEIDEYLDEPAIKANLKNLPLFKIEENAMIKIPEENIKDMSMQAEKSFDKTRSDSLSSDPVKDEIAERRLAEIKKKFRISQKKLSVIDALKAMAIASLIICLLFLLIPVVKTGDSSQNIFSLIFYDFKHGFPKRAGTQTGDGCGLWELSVLAFGSDKAWQTAIYPVFSIMSAITVIWETLVLIILILGEILSPLEKKRIQKMREEERLEEMKTDVEQQEADDKDFSMLGIIGVFLISTGFSLIFIFTLAVTMFYPLYVVSKDSLLSLVCEIDLGGMVMALLFGILYFILRLMTNVMSVKYDLYIHENNDRYE